MGNLLLLVVISHVKVKMAESIAANIVSPFLFSKNWGRKIEVVTREYSYVNCLQNH